MASRGKGLLAAGFAAICLTILPVLRADDTATVDFPISGRQKTPDGLSAPPRQVATPEGIGYTELLLRPAHKGEQIFLTFIFDENGKSGPGVFWRGEVSGEQMTLSKDLAEGVRGLNRRTIALPPAVAAEAGRIYVTGRQDQLLRIRIDWCSPTSTYVVPDQERPALFAAGKGQFERDLLGEPLMTPPDAWFGEVLDASVQDGVAELAGAVEFVLNLDGPVNSSRFRAQFLGLPLGRSVKIWVNGKFVGRIMPDAPPLVDPGYVRRNGHSLYAGWREGGIFLEPGVLVKGENSVIVQAVDKKVFIRGAALELESLPVAEAPKEDVPPPELPESETNP